MKYNQILSIIKRDKIILNNLDRRTTPNTVNVHYYEINKCTQNIGDYLSLVVVEYMKKLMNIDENKKLTNTRHLYAIGSIIQNGFQNATIWGSGFLNNPLHSKMMKLMKYYRKMDIRAVRGPNTYDALKKLGYQCPEVFGDPAILMPLIFQPECKSIKKKEYSVIRHMADNSICENKIDILTNDYKKFINEIVSSNLIISSSLHGIILSEAYGIPAVLYRPKNLDNSLFKFEDYYFSTGRMTFPIAESIDEAIKTEPCALPDFSQMQKDLIEAFPKDLYL